MNTIKYIFTGYLCLILTQLSYGQILCTHCKMDVKDPLFRAKVITKADDTHFFDAIECLVNYLKDKDEDSYKEILVTSYSNQDFINASKAVYLKSKAIPSPMGANLSAYATTVTAKAIQKEKGGRIYTWKALKEHFVSPDFGTENHVHQHHSANAYAPSSIMGDHLHTKGGLMVSLRYMSMAMDGNREGNNNITDESIFENFMVVPQNMVMQMYMLGVMYAPSNRLTLLLMQNFATKSMDLTARMMMNNMPMLRDFTTSSDVLGDLKIGALYGLFAKEKSSLHLNFKFNIPTGDIKNRDATPIMANVKLPYTMQLGSGTFDFTIGSTFKGNHNDFSWGIQQLNTFRTGENSQEYRFGNMHELHSWLAYGFSNTISSSIRISGSSEGRLNGTDPELNPMIVTTANPSNYGGEVISGALGLNILLTKYKLVFSAEIGTPLYQNHNGIQMNQTLALNGALRYILL